MDDGERKYLAEIKKGVSEDEWKEYSFWLCNVCINWRDINEDKKFTTDKEIEQGFAVRRCELYCNANHDKRDFACEDFKINNDELRETIMGIITNKYIREGHSKNLNNE